MHLLDWLVGVPGPTIVANRVTLRPPALSDYSEWRDLRQVSRAFLTPWEPKWAPDELTRKFYMARLARYRQDGRQRTGLTFFLRQNGTGLLCGGITLGNIRRGVAQSGVFGYWMGAPFAGQGLMEDALGRLSAYAFEIEKLHRLEAACLPNNRRSIALLEKSGFSHEGHLRKYLMIDGTWEDHRLYALLSEDRDLSSRTASRQASEIQFPSRSPFPHMPQVQPSPERTDAAPNPAGSPGPSAPTRGASA